MKWDNEHKVPIEGTYMPLAIPGEEILGQLRADYLGSDKDWENVEKGDLSAFSVEELSVDEFMLQHRYRNIEGRLPLMEELIHQTARFKSQDVACHLSDIVDSVTSMSKILDELSLEEKVDLLCRLYFCEKEEDFWDILLDGIGNPMDWARSYMGEMLAGHTPKTADDERFGRFVRYMELKGRSIFTQIKEQYV